MARSTRASKRGPWCVGINRGIPEPALSGSVSSQVKRLPVLSRATLAPSIASRRACSESPPQPERVCSLPKPLIQKRHFQCPRRSCWGSSKETSISRSEPPTSLSNRLAITRLGTVFSRPLRTGKRAVGAQRTQTSTATLLRRRKISPAAKQQRIRPMATKKRGCIGCHSASPRIANRIVPGRMPIALAQK